MPFDPKKGRRQTYFKTDLFYAFIIKANLFSKCAMSEWNRQMIRGDWAAASRSNPLPPQLPPPIPQSAKAWAPELTQRASHQGGTFSWKSWAKDLIPLSTLDDPLGLRDVKPLKGNVYSCVHKSTALRAPQPPPVCSRTTSRHQSAGKGRQNGSLCQTAPRILLPDGARIQCKGQRKRFGTTGPSAQTHSSSLDFSHSLIPFWSGSHL